MVVIVIAEDGEIAGAYQTTHKEFDTLSIHQVLKSIVEGDEESYEGTIDEMLTAGHYHHRCLMWSSHLFPFTLHNGGEKVFIIEE